MVLHLLPAQRAILAATLAHKPGSNKQRLHALVRAAVLLQFGPTIVIGSVIGSHVNYFIPSWVTKILVMLLMLPMAWRTISKAKLAW